MNGLVSRILWVMNQGTHFLWGEWSTYVTTILLMSLLASVAIGRPFRDAVWKFWYNILFGQVLFYPMIATVAVLGWNPGAGPMNRSEPIPIAVWSVVILNVVSVATGILLVFKMKGARWFSFIFFLSNQWLLQGINLMATMAIGGVWL